MKDKWPKILPFLTEDQIRIKTDFMKHWHEVLPRKYGIIEEFNHGYPIKNSKGGTKVLEIGAGLGEHLSYENLDNIEYTALELLPTMAEVIKRRFPTVNVLVGDCQKPINLPDKYFDRVLAIHVLEHLPNLPAALAEIRRLLNSNGEFCVVIPCEGGLVYSFARIISAKRIFEKRYNMNYDWCIKSEHVNTAKEIVEELQKFFIIKKRQFFPFFIPSVTLNLVIGLILKPRN